MDMSFHQSAIPTTISPLHLPTANHQVQDFKNCLAFSGNTFDNEQHPTHKDIHKTEDNLNSMINKVCINLLLVVCI